MSSLLKYRDAAIKLFSNNVRAEKDVNQFLCEYNGYIIDIQITEQEIMVVYKYKED